MRKTATDLRSHLYEVLDDVAATGHPVEIVRGGVTLCIVRKDDRPKRKKSPRKLRNLIVGDPDALIHIEWPWSRGSDL